VFEFQRDKMRILVATNVGGLDDNVSMVFARAPTFTIIEAEGNEIKSVDVIPNQFANAVHGAGIQVAQFIASQGVNVVIGGNFGPNVSSILGQYGIQMISAQGRVRDVVEKFLKGELTTQPAGATTMPSPPAAPPMPPMPSMPATPPMPEQSMDERIKMLEKEIARIEDLVKEVKKAIKELKEE